MKKTILCSAVILVLIANSSTVFGRQQVQGKAESDAKALLEKASALIDQRGFEAAISLLTEAVKKYPSSAPLYSQLGRALLNKLLFTNDAVAESQAREHLLKAIAIDSGSAEPLYYLGRIEAFRGRRDKAVAYYDQAIKIDPGFARAYIEKWRTLLKGDDFEIEIPKIRAEIEGLLRRKEDREAVLVAAITGYEIIADHESRRIIQEKIISEFPNSDLAEELLFDGVFQEEDAGRQAGLIEKFLARYPQNSNSALMLRVLFSIRLNQAATPPSEIVSLAERWIKAPASDANEMSRARAAVIIVLADRKLEPARALNLADETVKFFDEMKTDSPLLAGVSPGQRADSLAMARQRAHEARGFALIKAGKLDEAAKELNDWFQPVIREVEKNGYILWKDMELREIGARPRALWLAELYEAQGDYKRASKYLLASYGDDERANQFIRERLPVVYNRLGRSTAEAATDLNAAQTQYRSLMEAMEALTDEDRKKILGQRIESPAPDFVVTKLNKAQSHLSDYKGKVVVLNYWATWCGPCVAEMQHLQKLFDRYKNDPDTVILAISIDENRPAVRPFIEKNGYTMPVAYDNNSARMLRLEGVPTTFIIDRNGIIQFKDVGFGSNEKKYLDLMALRIDALLKEQATPGRTQPDKEKKQD